MRTPAKINLFLEVHGRRPDGYHAVTTLLTALDWHDRVEIEPAEEDHLVVTGAEVPADGSNLVWRAVAAARSRREIPPLSIRLHKAIPPGSGFGGGSSNAAGTLVLLQELYPHASAEPLDRVAAELGSDVPFFLGDGWALATGRGEVLEDGPRPPLGGDRPWFLLVIPELPSSTPTAYGALSFPLTSPDGPITFPTRTFVTSRRWMTGLFNRLERPVLTLHEGLAALAERLESTVAGRWRMTGSGSAFYVVCETRLEADGLARILAEEWNGVSLTTQVARISSAVVTSTVPPGGKPVE